ncbi:hypothetical protein ACFVVU_22440 [Kitasatospora sp. NPDC057965]|uniref:hypothetical protein n=1 Tax=Kitasatospora sp. NPDC057965 TaxID=3346291 RepID=UPI0036D99DA3
MQVQTSALLTAGVVALAFFTLVGSLVWMLRETRRPAAVLAVVVTLLGALPAILYVISVIAAPAGSTG